jgi:DNA-binding CsgD family transcriptional regulator
MRRVIGRERELSAVASFLADASTGCVALVLEGEAGVGKSTVWEEALRLSGEAGFRVLRCRAAQAEAKLAFASVTDLVGTVEEDVLERLPEPQRLALDVALLRATPSESSSDSRTVGTALLSTLTRLADTSPLLIAVDDVQWLDTASAVVLEFALRRLRDERVGVLLTERTSHGTTLSSKRFVEAGRRTEVRIEPLTLAATHHVLKEHLGRSPSRPLLVRIHRAAGGNPLFALEIARLFGEIGEPRADEPLPVPADVGELVRRRIARLPPPTRELLLAASSLSNPREDVLHEVFGRAPERALGPAERAGIARLEGGFVRFAHPLYASAIYSFASAEERREIHRRLADVLQDSEERARHLALGVSGRDERVATAVHEAAHDSGRRAAPAVAAELVELSLALGDSDRETEVTRLFDLATYLAYAGDNKRAWQVLEEIDLRREWPANMPASAVELLFELEYWINGPSARLDELGESVLGSELPIDVRARAHASLAMYGEHDLVRAAAHSQSALTLLESLGSEADPRVHASALACHLRNELVLGDGLDRAVLARVLELEARIPPGRDRLLPPSDDVGQWLKYVDELDESRTLLERGLRHDLEVGYEKSVMNRLQHLALTECWAGNLELALDYAVRACEFHDREDISVLGYAPAILAIVQAHRGEAAAVEEVAERYRAAGTEATIHLQVALGQLELARERYEAALDHLGRVLETMRRAGLREPGIHRVHADAAEAALVAGDPERATAIVGELERHGARTDHRWSLATSARVRALLAAAAGDLDEALSSSSEALRLHDVLPMPLERARTMLVHGQLLRRRGERRASREALGEALASFESSRARLWAERARAELARIPIKRESGAALTAAESRVADLVAKGRTNQEVAQALFISQKTVEANLTRVYRKLGVRSRAALAARMHEGEAGEGPAKA